MSEEEDALNLLDDQELSRYRRASGGVGAWCHWWICDTCSAVIESRAKHTLWHERTRS
jgi:hypothetical protein